ncbi:uncharacterized protein LOC130936301 [Arachis stenosperma]|uniref:uncharacterized protein LOC130936301 n=1 Tax=Arachis stenosperma TaxID=217475 RepID=UPI0025AC913A|nr:uncharacterized protein LOC130936301 [Arachis stenosperma]XP_057722331.1 uncharacterized protein LOC130936301 [Arachis stenosperma]
MANKYFQCVIEEMDRLWFHQVILFTEPSAKPSPIPKPEKQKSVAITESLSSQSSIFSMSQLPDGGSETSTNESTSPEKQASSESISDDALPGGSTINKNKKERSARVKVLANRIRSHSSSPSSQHRHKRFRNHATTSSESNKLEKSMSCKTLRELELDEVKGFMDLGFIFKKETLSPWMMSIVPGLQRLGLLQNQNVEVKRHTQRQLIKEEVENGEKEESDEEEKRVIMRPYLSEAWLIKRPDSPLLSLKVPKACSASNMKKHLRFWARTVASEIHQ